MNHIVINAEGLILGRMAAFAAKRALLGDKVDIVNCEKVVISGSKVNVLERYRTKLSRGAPLTGPYYARSPDRMVRRTIRGMLPYKKSKGRDAYERVMCYKGIPADLKGKMVGVKSAEAGKLPNLKYMTMGEVMKLLGAR